MYPFDHYLQVDSNSIERGSDGPSEHTS
jgi:hypothetical protein